MRHVIAFDMLLQDSTVISIAYVDDVVRDNTGDNN
jgi:hypothetical protein